MEPALSGARPGPCRFRARGTRWWSPSSGGRSALGSSAGAPTPAVQAIIFLLGPPRSTRPGRSRPGAPDELDRIGRRPRTHRRQVTVPPVRRTGQAGGHPSPTSTTVTRSTQCVCTGRKRGDRRPGTSVRDRGDLVHEPRKGRQRVAEDVAADTRPHLDAVDPSQAVVRSSSSSRNSCSTPDTGERGDGPRSAALRRGFPSRSSGRRRPRSPSNVALDPGADEVASGGNGRRRRGPCMSKTPPPAGRGMVPR